MESWVGSHPVIGDIVVVDWSSDRPIHQDARVKRLCDEGKIKIVRVEGEKHFSLSRSYNLAYHNSDPLNRVLLKLDADYKLVDPRWMNHVRDQLIGEEGISNDGRLLGYYIVGSHLFSRNYTGFLLVNKNNFLLYNENMEGYGHDDIELYDRTRSRFPALKEVVFFNIKDYIFHIPHSDDARVANYANKDMLGTSMRNMGVSPDFDVSRYNTLLSEGNVLVVERIKN